MDILITFLAGLGLLALGAALYHWWLKKRPQTEFVTGPHRCEDCLCELPKASLRTHDGHWLCETDKRRRFSISLVSTTQR